MSADETAAPAPTPPSEPAAAAGGTVMSDDERRLHDMGYAQELRRHMSGFSNFAVSFTIISILSGCLTLYGTGMNTGGPALITWGWPFVGIMTLIVGLAMAEVCSSYPTAGGLYYWSAKLAKKNAAGLVVVHRLVQLPGPGRGHGRHRLRRGVLPQRPARPAVGLRHPALAHDPAVRRDPGRARAAEPVRRERRGHAQRRQRLVAHHRRPAHRGRAGLRAQPPPVGLVRVRALRQQHRLGLDVLRRAARPAAGPVHVHRLRRLGPHDRGDPGRGHGRARAASSPRSWSRWRRAGCC